VKRKIRGRRYARLKLKLGLPDLEQAKAAVLASLRSRSLNAAISIRSMNLSLGIVPLRVCHSVKPW
jgi:hypothetical protein